MDGRLFLFIKFRTMRAGSDDRATASTSRSSSRVSPTRTWGRAYARSTRCATTRALQELVVSCVVGASTSYRSSGTY